MSHDTVEHREGPEIHHGHRDVTGGWLRPAVFGLTDGVVSNIALISGVAGGRVSAHTVALTGLAGLVAGAFSMATGEYTSVRSQNEAMAAEVDVERRELARAPRAEMAELAAVYRDRGVEPELALEVARQISRNPETALRVHAQEELGFDLDKPPSPYTAAFSSFGAFALGALLPLLPYLLGATTLVLACVLSGIALFALGGAVGRLNGRPVVYSGLRQLLFGALAATVTYGIGRAVGAGVS